MNSPLGSTSIVALDRLLPRGTLRGVALFLRTTSLSALIDACRRVGALGRPWSVLPKLLSRLSLRLIDLLRGLRFGPGGVWTLRWGCWLCGGRGRRSRCRRCRVLVEALSVAPLLLDALMGLLHSLDSLLNPGIFFEFLDTSSDLLDACRGNLIALSSPVDTLLDACRCDLVALLGPVDALLEPTLDFFKGERLTSLEELNSRTSREFSSVSFVRG